MAEIKNYGHTGNWGLPEFGVTEWISDFRDQLQGNPAGAGRTDQGGSDLDGSSAQQKLDTATTNYNNAVSTPPTTPPVTTTPKPTTTTQKTTQTNTGSSGGGQNARLAAWLAQGGQGDIPVGWNPNDQGGNNDAQFNKLLEDAYGGVINQLNNWKSSVSQGELEDTGTVNSQFSDTEKNLEGQRATEQQSLEEQGRQLWESFRKASGQGAQNYAQRLRGLVNMYGLGNSTGQTMAQLLANKQAEVEGGLGEQKLQGERALALEGVKLSRYIDNKKNELVTWKNQALNSIRQNVRDKLNQIEQMKGEAEVNKTNAKIALLQQTIAVQKQIEAADAAARQNLAQWSVQQLANVQQDNFDVSQVPQVYYNTVNQLQQLSGSNPAQQGNGVTLSPVAKNTDEYASLFA
jgi:hypothetical protein